MSIFMVVLLSLASVYVIASVFIIRNLLRKVEIYESWIKNVYDSMDQIYNKLLEIDSAGYFRSNDYIGEIYTKIYNMVKLLNDFLYGKNS